MEPIQQLSEITLELDKRKGETDVAYFIERFGHIRDAQNKFKTIPFKLFPEQKRALNSIVNKPAIQLLKARQLGFTWLALHWSLHQNHYIHRITGFITSRAELEVIELMNRYEFIMRNCPELFCNFKDRLIVNSGWNGTFYEKNSLSIRMLHEDDESRIIGFPSNKNSGVSFTGAWWIADEHAKQEDAEEIFGAIFPAIDNPESKFISLSTIERGSFFEKLWLEDNGIEKVFLSCFADPRRNQEWYDKMLLKMGVEKMYRYYPRTIEEAFLIPGGAFFPEYSEEIHTTPYLKTLPCTRYIAVDYGLDMLAAYWVAVYDDGTSIVYRELAKSDLNADQAAQTIKDMTGTESIALRFAAKDLWSRKATGPTIAETFERMGVPLYMVSNSVENGCNALKMWLAPTETDGQNTTKMRLLKGACPELEKSLKNIQKNKLNPNIYETKTSHKLTHPIDSMRYFASGRPMAIQNQINEQNDYDSFLNYGR